MRKIGKSVLVMFLLFLIISCSTYSRQKETFEIKHTYNLAKGEPQTAGKQRSLIEAKLALARKIDERYSNSLEQLVVDNNISSSYGYVPQTDSPKYDQTGNSIEINIRVSVSEFEIKKKEKLIRKNKTELERLRNLAIEFDKQYAEMDKKCKEMETAFIESEAAAELYNEYLGQGNPGATDEAYRAYREGEAVYKQKLGEYTTSLTAAAQAIAQIDSIAVKVASIYVEKHPDEVADRSTASSPSDSNTVSNLAPTDSLVYSYITLEEEGVFFDDMRKHSCGIYARYPVFALDTPSSRAIARDMSRMLQSSPDEFLSPSNNLRQLAKQKIRRMEKEATIVELHDRFEILLNQQLVTVFHLSADCPVGAAHGSEFFDYTMYHTNGTKIDYLDLIPSENLAALRNLMVKYYNGSFQNRMNQDYATKVTPRIYVLVRDGLLVSYEGESFAEGSPNLTIPKAEILPLLKEKYREVYR